MSEQKAWQPSTIQVETAAMALRAQQMRLWNLVAALRVPSGGRRDAQGGAFAYPGKPPPSNMPRPSSS